MITLVFLAVVANLGTFQVISAERDKYTVYCPESGPAGKIEIEPENESDRKKWVYVQQRDDRYENFDHAKHKNFETMSHEYGLNIYAHPTSTKFAADCYLRFTETSKPVKNSITSHFYNSASNKILIMIHGWQNNFGANPTHRTPDGWINQITDDERNELLITNWRSEMGGDDEEGPSQWACVPEAEGGAKCLPNDHDAQEWYAKGWNVIFVDWKEYAYYPIGLLPKYGLADATTVRYPERRMYNPVRNGENVVQLVSNLLHGFLDTVEFPKEAPEGLKSPDEYEIRIAGNSLGAQQSLLHANEIYNRGFYSKAMKRVVLLDPYWTGYKYMTPKGKMTNSKWARHIAERIKSNGGVVTFYKTSTITNSMQPIITRANKKLMQSAIFVRLHFKYLGKKSQIWQPSATAKHVSAMGHYLRCMKWNERPEQERDADQYFTPIPTCQASTERLAKCYTDDKCIANWEQVDGMLSVKDSDDIFKPTRKPKSGFGFTQFTQQAQALYKRLQKA